MYADFLQYDHVVTEIRPPQSAQSVVEILLDDALLAQERAGLSEQAHAARLRDEGPDYELESRLGYMEATPGSLALRRDDQRTEELIGALHRAPRLDERYFFDVNEMQRNTVQGRCILIEAGLGQAPIELPLANFVSAYGLTSWQGREGKMKAAGAYGIARRSEAVIDDYAAQDTAAPPLETVSAYLQPNGVLLYATEQGAHRTAAAIKRGDESTATKSLKVRLLLKDFVEADQ